MAEAFPEYAVSRVSFEKCEALHLKDVFNMAGKNVLAVAPGPDVQAVLHVSFDSLEEKKVVCKCLFL